VLVVLVLLDGVGVLEALLSGARRRAQSPRAGSDDGQLISRFLHLLTIPKSS
jgi:hypothetical protein